MKKQLACFCVVLVFVVFFSCSDEEQKVTLSSFEPTQGDFNSEVVITGSNFNPAAEKNQVLFNGKSSEVISASPTQLIAKVAVGATTGKVTVISGGVKIVSVNDFLVTAGEWIKKANTPQSVSSNAIGFNIGNRAYFYFFESSGSVPPVSSALWMYDPLKDAWTQKTVPQATQFYSGVAVAWNTKTKGYLFENMGGSFDSKKIYEYDPTSDLWSIKSNLPAALRANSVVAAVYISDVNRAYLILGNGIYLTYFPGSDTWGQSVPSQSPFASEITSTQRLLSHATTTNGYLKTDANVWELEPDLNTWRKVSVPPSGAYNFSFGIADSFFLGDTGTSKLFMYDKASDKWIQKSGLEPGGISTYISLDGKGYLGINMKSTTNAVLRDFYEFNP